jgi:hypothetical protein
MPRLCNDDSNTEADVISMINVQDTYIPSAGCSRFASPHEYARFVGFQR